MALRIGTARRHGDFTLPNPTKHAITEHSRAQFTHATPSTRIYYRSIYSCWCVLRCKCRAGVQLCAARLVTCVVIMSSAFIRLTRKAPSLRHDQHQHQRQRQQEQHEHRRPVDRAVVRLCVANPWRPPRAPSPKAKRPRPLPCASWRDCPRRRSISCPPGSPSSRNKTTKSSSIRCVRRGWGHGWHQ